MDKNEINALKAQVYDQLILQTQYNQAASQCQQVINELQKKIAEGEAKPDEN